MYQHIVEKLAVLQASARIADPADRLLYEQLNIAPAIREANHFIGQRKSLLAQRDAIRLSLLISTPVAPIDGEFWFACE